MKNRFYILALAVSLAPGLALAQANPNYGYPGQQNEHDHGMQRQDRDQRMDQGYYRGSRQDAGNIDRMLHQRFPNSDIQANYQDNETVVLTGTAATGHDRKDAVDFVRSQLGGARVVDQIQVTGYGRGGYPNGAYQSYPNGAYQNAYPTGDQDRENGYNREGTGQDNYGQRTDHDRDRYGQQNDRYGQQVDRDQNSRVPQSDVDANRTDRDRNYANEKDRNTKDKNHKDKDKKNKKDKNKQDHDRRPDQDQQPH